MKKKSHKKKGARLGQHLLKNPVVAREVITAADIHSGDTVLEIGPGAGFLTQEILEVGGIVVAVEKDPLMLEKLKEKFPKEIASKKLILIEGDARTYTPDIIFTNGNYKVAANIPYYITGELLRECMTAKNQPVGAAFLVQKEVAERIARSKKESILSLSIKAYGTPKYVRTVSKGNFNPPPSVDSAILGVTNISRKNFKAITEELFFKTVKAGFAQKRKTIGGNLKKVFGQKALEALANLAIPEKTRAEDMPLETWLELAKQISGR
jgi:16S rRNA (adenine1518-N6/adenine1519-N6)-dimethyltransferase